MLLSTSTNQRFALITSLVLAAVLTLYLAKLTWAVFAPEQRVVGSSDVDTGPITTPVGGLSSIRQLKKSLAEHNPWHSVMALSADSTVSLEDAEESTLDITLLGTMVLRGMESWAVVTEGKKGNDQQVVREGDLIAGVRLERISRKAIYLRNKGRLEVISMFEDELSAETVAQATPGKAKTIKKTAKRRATVYEIPRSRYTDLLQQGMGLLKGVGINPYMSGAKSQGYQVTLPEGSVFGDFGLKSGDVVETVNGVPVTEATKIGGLLRNLSQQEEVAVDIMRDGNPRKIVIDIR